MKSGILLVNKPSNMTSRDVVNVICKKLNTKKVGHTGTLDPLATGLLIICVNQATKVVDLITGDDKEYIAKVKLGIRTDTLDIEGNILEKKDNYKLDKNKLIEVLKSFKKTYMQEVPIYSAVKVNGKKLYEYARENKQVTLPKHEVTIKEISLLSIDKDSFTFKVLVSKGTYIRSLIRDISIKLNVLMTMEKLTRTKINNYSLKNAKDLDEVSESDLIKIDNFLPYLKVEVSPYLKKKIINGVRIDNIYNQEYVMFMEKNKLLAIYKDDGCHKLCMYKCFKDDDFYES